MKEFPLLVIEDLLYKSNKWLVLKKNIGKTYIGGCIGFSESHQKALLRNARDKFFGFTTLFLDMKKEYGEDEVKWRPISKIRTKDAFRNFTVQEYQTLGQVLRQNNFVFNKKKEQLIDKTNSK